MIDVISLKGLDDISRKYENSLQKVERAERELLEMGRERADLDFKGVVYKGDRNVNVTPNFRDADDFELRASGKSVIFMEYGSGVYAYHPLGSSKGFTPDSWSKDHKREFHDKGYWHYGGETMNGQPSAKAMYNARKIILNNANKKIGEVFK